MCGKTIEALDGRRKYCDDCREIRKHFFDKNAVENFRKRAKEKRRAEKELIENQSAEIQRLKKIISTQREKILLLQSKITK